MLTELKGALEVPSPARWPGASEPALERPDDVKFELTEFLTRREPGKSKLEQLENRFLKGPLSYLPEIDHWAMEEFFYHGLPGDSWHPIEAFLAREGDRFNPPGRSNSGVEGNARRAFRAGVLCISPRKGIFHESDGQDGLELRLVQSLLTQDFQAFLRRVACQPVHRLVLPCLREACPTRCTF